MLHPTARRWTAFFLALALGGALAGCRGRTQGQAQPPAGPPSTASRPAAGPPPMVIPASPARARTTRPMGATTMLAPRTSGAIPVRVEIDERISPAIDCNPVRTQHTLVATVYDACGNPLPGQRVEWLLARYPEAVGDIVAVDDQYGTGVIPPLGASMTTNAGNKLDNHYAVSVTNEQPELIDAGSNHPFLGRDGTRLPDIVVGRGQSWVTITSTREGVTDLIVVVPGIKDGTLHKIFAKKVWVDMAVEFPESAENTLPNDEHLFPVRVHRMDESGIPGQVVEAEILDGPPAVFTETDNAFAEFLTDANGEVMFTLRNTTGTAGVNRIRFTALGDFYGEVCPRSAIITKTWRNVSLDVSCRYGCGAVAYVGKPFEKTITVTNTGDAVAENVVLDDRPDPALTILDGVSFPRTLGSLQPGESRDGTIRVVANRAGLLVNRVIATADPGNVTVENECSIEVVQGQLEITKVCDPQRVNAGEEIAFVVEVANTGRGPLENVMVVDDYPAGVEPTSQGQADLGTLQPGDVKQIVFSGVAEEPGRYTNTARAMADGVEEQQASCTVQVVLCRMEMDLSGPSQVYYGEPADFTVTLRNLGDGDAPGCQVRLTSGGCVGEYFRDFNVGPLPPGGVWTQNFTLTGTRVGTATVVADSSCGTRCQARRDIQLRVTGLPALQVEMVDKALDGSEGGVFRIGETFNYRLTVLNDVGTEITPDLRVLWDLPPELEFVSGRSDRGATVSGTGTRAESSAFSLGLQELITFEIQVRVLAESPSGFVEATAVVTRASDGAQFSKETESTSLRR